MQMEEAAISKIMKNNASDSISGQQLSREEQAMLK